VTPSPLRSLDAEVAETVFGWESFRCGYFGTEDETPRMEQLSDWMDRVGLDAVGDYFIDEAAEFFVSAEDFRPSKDIATAWQVHQKMCGSRLGVRIRYFDALKAQTEPIAGFRVAWPDVLVVLRDTMPEAICRAALEAR
jgi:hypothetical protein